MPPTQSRYDENLSPQDLAAAMRSDSQGMRDMESFLESVRDLDDAAFAEATSGTDRTEALLLLERVKSLLAETDQLIASLEAGDVGGADRPPN